MDTVKALANWIGQQPTLAWLGALLVIATVFAPLVLSLAGLTGEQIVDVIKTTLTFALNLIAAFRQQNTQSKP